MVDLGKRYQRKDDIVFRKINDEMILVPIKNNVGDMGSIYNLNEVGAFVWENLDGRNSLLDIRNLITEAFAVCPEKAEADLCDYVAQLLEIEALSTVK